MSLTKHKEGSLKELWTIAFPLMLSSFSVLTMVFADRWFLAHYSMSALNAAVSATTFGWGIIFGWMSLASISEVFVAQYNGAGMRHKAGEPVWQMIWVAFASCLFFFPVSYFGTPLFFGSESEFALERDYFSIMLLFGPFYVFYGALCGFFVGQGKTRLITWVVVAANFFNILLDWLLIFGVEGYIPSLGVKGAAIATSFAVVFQGLILGCVFLNRKNRTECGTLVWKPQFKAMFECLKIGLPTSIFIVAEMSAFGLYYVIMKDKGPAYITVAGVCQTMFILCIFFAEGLNKAMTAIAGNLIGAGRSFMILKLLKAGLILNLFFLAAVLVIFLCGTSLIINELLPLADPFFVEEIYPSLQLSLLFFAFYMFFDGLRIQFSGVLIAAGDTLFLLVSGASLVWVCMLLPVYILVGLRSAPVEMGAFIFLCYGILSSLVCLWRVQVNQRESIPSLISQAVQE